MCVTATHTHTHCTHRTPTLKIQHCFHSDVVNTLPIIMEGMQQWVSLQCAYRCVCVDSACMHLLHLCMYAYVPMQLLSLTIISYDFSHDTPDIMAH